MQGAKCAISKLMYGLSVCTDDNHSLKLVAYRLVHTDEPYINLHIILCNMPEMQYAAIFKSNRKAMNRNWSNQKANSADLKPKRDINNYCK